MTRRADVFGICRNGIGGKSNCAAQESIHRSLMRVAATWYGTAAMHLVVDESLGVFFDPWFARPPGARPRIMADVAPVDLEPLDVILASHSHFDHVYNLPDLVRRHPRVQAYVPALTTQNCRRLCSRAIFKDYACRLTESD
jgi:glyoxylase-like metal-dependent hydrolase (beta-lactamase superfamily II)